MNIFYYFKHFFLPQETNNHRAKILHPRGITALLSFLIVMEVSLRIFSFLAPDILGFATDISVNKLLEQTNQKRLESGIAPLSLNEQLSQSAFSKANDMFKDNYWSHISPSGKTPWDFIVASGYSYIYAGENLAKDFQDATGVVDAWMNSPTHKENLLQEKYQEVGFAVVNGLLNGEETTLVVQMFGTNKEKEILNPIEKIILLPSPTIIVNLKRENLDNSSIGVVAVKNTPRFDLFKISKSLNMIVVFILVAILLIDTYLVSRKKIVRISGDSIAHLLFLISLLAVLWATGRGSII